MGNILDFMKKMHTRIAGEPENPKEQPPNAQHADKKARRWEELVPPELDPEYYLAQTNLKDATPWEASKHFFSFGKDKGLMGSPLSDPNEFISWLQKAFTNSDILEIGPGHSPKFEGAHVKYFDLRNHDELVAWANTFKLAPEKIPPTIHFHSPTADMAVIDEQFDLVFSSHNIEHQKDLIRHMQDVARVLKPNGLFALIVPDKRYIFDHNRTPSSVEDVVSKYVMGDGMGRFSLKSYLHHYLSGDSHNFPAQHWQGNHGTSDYESNLLRIPELIANYDKTSEYPDHHIWIFTDESFYKIFHILYRIGLIPLKPIRVFNVPRNGNSFCAIFTNPDNT